MSYRIKSFGNVVKYHTGFKYIETYDKNISEFKIFHFIIKIEEFLSFNQYINRTMQVINDIILS